MKISLNWINDFVNLKGIDIKDIISRFSLTTAEVDGYEHKGQDIKGVVVGEIVTCEKHPTSNKPLSVLTVNAGKVNGKDEIIPVVCGAPNCRVGMKVALAKAGARLGSVEISKTKLAGYDSHGMCCGGDEIGISSDHSGIIELDTRLVNGTSITEAIPDMLDTIIEIDNKSLTNRPDLWGHFGIAREFAVIFGKTLKTPKTTDLAVYNDLPKVPIKVENKKDCLSYGAIRVDNIILEKSPIGMQTRLFYCGINPHNFLVDLTNYVMLETGQPNHAFDARKIGKISIGSSDEATFITLKNQTVNIKPEMLFIKSDGAAVALAGVIGGKNSEINADTRDCVFEFATFDAACVRKTAAAIGVRTDASNRYEKALDVNLNILAASRTIQIIKDYDKKAKVASAFSHIVLNQPVQAKLTIKKDYLERFCGVSFDYKQVEKKLGLLGFAPSVSADAISVTVPSWRATKDVTSAVDVIEEIVRTYGYDNIVPSAPRASLSPIAKLPTAKIRASVKRMLSEKYGFDEVHTYIWNDTKLNTQLNITSPSYLRVVNSCVKDNDAIRSEMMPSMLCAAAKNKKTLGDIRIFEIGSVINKDKKEERHLGICLYSATESTANLYKRLGDILRDIFGKLNYKIGAASQNYLHPKNSAAIEGLGVIGIVHPQTLQNAVAAEINLEKLSNAGETEQMAKLSKYPKTVLDFTFTTTKIYGEVEAIFGKFKNPLCMGWRLKDIFTESDNSTSYTLAFTVGSYEKTLESREIDSVWQSIVEFLTQNGLKLKETLKV